MFNKHLYPYDKSFISTLLWLSIALVRTIPNDPDVKIASFC